MEIQSYIAEQSDIEYIFNLCKNSSYVASNATYLKKANKTTATLEENIEMINAMAGKIKGLDSYEISVFGGLSNMFILVATALAFYMKTKNKDKLINTCRWIGRTIRIQTNYTFSTDLLNDGMKEFNYILCDSMMQESISYFSGILLSVIGHELGHICLSHLEKSSINNQTSRNDERSADLFAQSIISTTPFSQYTIIASLFLEIMFTWLSKNIDIATTHPYSKERVYNVLNSHEEYLRSVGITKNNIDQFLP